MIMESVLLGMWIATGLVWNGDRTTASLGWMFTLASTGLTIYALTGM